MKNSIQTFDRDDLKEQNRKLLMTLIGIMLFLAAVSLVTILVKN